MTEPTRSKMSPACRAVASRAQRNEVATPPGADRETMTFRAASWLHRSVALLALASACSGEVSSPADSGVRETSTGMPDVTLARDAGLDGDGASAKDAGSDGSNRFLDPLDDASFHDAESPYPCGEDQAYVIFEFPNEHLTRGICGDINDACGAAPACDCIVKAASSWCEHPTCSADGGLTLVCFIAPDP
jgi:hypothetical protein